MTKQSIRVAALVALALPCLAAMPRETKLDFPSGEENPSCSPFEGFCPVRQPTAALEAASTPAESAPGFLESHIAVRDALAPAAMPFLQGGDAPAITPLAPLATVRRVAGEILEPAISPSTPSAWKTSEYSRSATVSSIAGASRLNLIHAAEGYARRITGRPGGGGITVAVIDEGIAAAHSQLDVARAFEYGAVTRRHGTGMAGIIAARRDGDGVHGVAYNANLVSLARVFPETTVEQSASDIASAAGLARTYGTSRSNPEASSHILNMSWIETSPSAPIRSAMQDAAGAGRIMVAALGNHGGAEPVGAPAIYSADEGIAGFAIAVGWLNEAGTARNASANNCGAVARYCLFAPGTKVLTTSVSGGEAVTSGSSNSTAYVSGAAAVVWAAFPNKRGDQVVGRLLSTARPLDSQEISSTYGHGALDLGAAMNPVGFLSLSVNGAPVALRDSIIHLPPGFALPGRDPALASAVVYDEQMFPFLADLNAVFRRSERLPFWWLSETVPHHHAGGEHPHHARTEPAFTPWPSPTGFAEPGVVRPYRLEFRAAERLALVLANGPGAVDAPDGLFASPLKHNLLQAPFAAAPFAAVAGPGTGVGIGWQIGEATALRFTGKRGNRQTNVIDALGVFGAGDLVSAGFVQRIGALALGADYGLLRERRSLLGVRGTGAFAGLRNVQTAFVQLRFETRLTQRLTAFGSVSEGATDGGQGAAGGLIAGWGATRLRSSLLGLEAQRLFSASDRLVLTASTPLRARQARLHLQVPHREVADGIVHHVRRTLDFSPRGRELQLQLAYAATAWKQRLSYALGANLRLQPHHRASAAPQAGVALKMYMAF